MFAQCTFKLYIQITHSGYPAACSAAPLSGVVVHTADGRDNTNLQSLQYDLAIGGFCLCDPFALCVCMIL